MHTGYLLYMHLHAPEKNRRFPSKSPFIFVLLVALIFLLSGCKNSPDQNLSVVTFDPNGGKTIGIYGHIEWKRNTPLTFLPTDVTRDGYVLYGWNRDPSATNKDEFIRVGKDETALTLYAVWVHQVTYCSNDACGYMQPEMIRLDTAWSVPDCEYTTNFARSFIGWSKEKTSVTPEYIPGQTISLSENLVVYAIWKNAIIDNFNHLKYLEDSTSHLAVSGYTDPTVSSITIPAAYDEKPITSIFPNAFQGYSALTILSLPDSISMIGAKAFSGSGISSIVIPESVTALGGGAFSSCGSLASVALSSSLTALPEKIFKGCTSLKAITIPENVLSIGAEAFAPVFVQSPNGLETITLDRWVEGDANPITTLVSSNALPKNAIKHIYVPSGSLQTYKDDANWKVFKDIIEVKP